MGVVFCLLSAAGFGAMAIFGKLAYDEDVSVLTLLVTRFVLAAVVFWALAAALPKARAAVRRGLGKRIVLIALALGAIGYATQAGLYFSALTRMDASLLALVLYTFPAWVALGAALLGRERFTARRGIALVVSSAGGVLVLIGAGAAGGSFDPLGAALGLGAALTYTVYILVSDGVVARVQPLLLSALVCSGAAVSLGIVGVAAGELSYTGLPAIAWLWLAGIALVSTVLAIVCFFLGLERVGPGVTAILSTVEPLVTVLLALLVFGEYLTPLQWAGAALVLSAIVLLQLRCRLLGRGELAFDQRQAGVPEPGVA